MERNTLDLGKLQKGAYMPCIHLYLAYSGIPVIYIYNTHMGRDQDCSSNSYPSIIALATCHIGGDYVEQVAKVISGSVTPKILHLNYFFLQGFGVSVLAFLFPFILTRPSDERNVNNS